MKSFSYKKTGVNIDAAEKSLKKVKNIIKGTFNKNVITDIGSFGGVYKISNTKYLVASTDGVGTKVKIAQKLNKHSSIGEDIVNHCVNDILVMGAKPLFFLDYIGIGKVKPDVISDIISGIAKACKKNNCVLIGGETAEMSDVYKKGEYDLVGTILGEVEKGKVITGNKIKSGDLVIGLASNGLHTNGYTLARKIFEAKKISYKKYFKKLGSTLGEYLLRPHKSYFKIIFPLLREYFSYIHGMVHITGGGFFDNIKRVLPENVSCIIDKQSWSPPYIFQLIKESGKVKDKEMYRVFNMGIGFVLIIDKDGFKLIEKYLNKKYEKWFLIGKITKGNKTVVLK